jgi:methylenetetrahydrofolate--tRNA-(uracil-5-)-methyltransferase
MHRNTFIQSPTLIDATMQFRERGDLFFAGQITGTEGYVGSTASGWLAGLNVAHLVEGQPLAVPPPTTMIGALCHYVAQAGAADFQPMKANFGLLPALDPPVRNKRARYAAYSRRALAELEGWLANLPTTRS